MMREFLESEFTEFQVCKSFESALSVSEGVKFLIKGLHHDKCPSWLNENQDFCQFSWEVEKTFAPKETPKLGTLTLYWNWSLWA